VNGHEQHAVKDEDSLFRQSDNKWKGAKIVKGGHDLKASSLDLILGKKIHSFWIGAARKMPLSIKIVSILMKAPS
jgi:hypothetical protein